MKRATQAARNVAREDPVIAYKVDADGLIPLRASALKSTEINVRGSAYTTRISADKHGIANAYACNVWVQRCVHTRALHVGGMPWRVVDVATQKEIDNHPLKTALLANPDTLYRTEWSLALWGETFLEAQQDGASTILQWLNPLGMQVDTAPGYIRSFQYTVVTSGGGKFYTLSPEQVVFLRLPNPFDDLRGLAPLTSVINEVRVDQNLSAFLAAFYENDARPGILLIPESPLSKADAERFMEFWKSNLQGVRNAGKPVLSPFNIKVVEVQRAPTEHDNEIRLNMFREICAAFGVPMSFAGGWDSATYQSAPEQRISFYADTIIPECELIASQINAYALPIFGDDNVRFEFVYDEVSALTASQRLKEETYTARWQAGALTLNEYREALGKPLLPSGDILLLGGRLVPVNKLSDVTFLSPSPASFLQSAPQALDTTSAESALQAWQKAAQQHPHTSFNASAVPQALRAEVRAQLAAAAQLSTDVRSQAIAQIFSEAHAALKNANLAPSASATPQEYAQYWNNYELLQAEIGDVWYEEYSRAALDALQKRAAAGQVITEATLQEVLNDLQAQVIDQWVGDEQTPGPFTRLVLAGAAAGQNALQGGTAAPLKVTLTVNWQLLDTLALHYARVAAGNAIRNINATTLQRFRQALADSMMLGESQAQLADRLNVLFLDEVRARRIAQTESTAVYSMGARARYAAADVQYVRFQTVRDTFVCPVCSPLHNTIAPLNDGWVGVQGNAFPPIHVGCRCFLRPVTQQELDANKWAEWA